MGATIYSIDYKTKTERMVFTNSKKGRYICLYTTYGRLYNRITL